jgi:hypothetical protein
VRARCARRRRVRHQMAAVTKHASGRSGSAALAIIEIPKQVAAIAPAIQRQRRCR